MKTERLLVAPAAELAWLREFYDAFVAEYGRSPRLDALAVHFYASGNVREDARALRRKLRDYRAQADEWGAREVWLTEFAHLTEPVAFLAEAGPWLADECDRFAWFATEYVGDEQWAFGMDRNTSLWRDGSLTPIGIAYKEL